MSMMYFIFRKLNVYIPDKWHVLDLELLDLDENLSYEEKPIEILDSKVRGTRRKDIRWWKFYGLTSAHRRQRGKLRISWVRNIHTFFLRLVSYEFVTKFLGGGRGVRMQYNFARFHTFSSLWYQLITNLHALDWMVKSISVIFTCFRLVVQVNLCDICMIINTWNEICMLEMKYVWLFW